MKIGEVDTVKEKFDADIFVQARWREPALDSHHPKVNIFLKIIVSPQTASETLFSI